MTEQAQEHMAYVAYCSECGGMVAAVVDDPIRFSDTAKEVARWLRDRDRIERVTCQFVRENLNGCTPDCPCKFCVKKRKAKPAPALPDLLAETTER